MEADTKCCWGLPLCTTPSGMQQKYEHKHVHMHTHTHVSQLFTVCAFFMVCYHSAKISYGAQEELDYSTRVCV